jgi:hypothetical protein
MMRYEAMVNGSKSVGVARKKADPSQMIFAFRVYGKLYWSGDLVHMREKKAEAWADLDSLNVKTGEYAHPYKSNDKEEF